MFGKLNENQVEQLIAHQVVGRIGCHADEMTYVVPVSYAYDGTYIYIRAFEGMKVEMMRKNPKVCFQVDDTKDLSNWQSVICQGEFEELNESAQRHHAIRVLTDRELPMISSETMHISPIWPFNMTSDDDVHGILFRIRLTSKTGRFEKSAESFYYAS